MSRGVRLGAPRVVFYSPDPLGLGHLTQMLTLRRHLHARWPGMTSLVFTGLSVADRVTGWDGGDFIKLPSVRQVGPWFEAAPYQPDGLSISFPQLRKLRRALLLAAVRHLRPDALFVDFTPAGLLGELVPALRQLRQSGAGLILSLRDIINDRQQVRRAWTRDRAYPLLDEIYDLILVHGQRDVWDLVREAGLSPRAAAKARYVGYLRRGPATRSPDQVRGELGLGSAPLVLVTVGGGADGAELLGNTLGMLRHWPGSRRYSWLLVTGPFMPASDRRRLRGLLPRVESARLVEFIEDMPSCVAAADAVVSMAGYNAVCEILSFGKPALLVPRREPSREQIIRAEALSRRGLVRMIHPGALTPATLLGEVRALLERPVRGPAPRALDLDGLSAVTGELEALLGPAWQAAHPIDGGERSIGGPTSATRREGPTDVSAARVRRSPGGRAPSRLRAARTRAR